MAGLSRRVSHRPRSPPSKLEGVHLAMLTGGPAGKHKQYEEHKGSLVAPFAANRPSSGALPPPGKAEEREVARPCPECARYAMRDMVSTGNRTALETDAYLAPLCVLFDRTFTWLTTFDLGSSTPPQSNNSSVSATDSVLRTCATTAHGFELASTDAALTGPDT